jgi:hypothetical protein
VNRSVRRAAGGVALRAVLVLVGFVLVFYAGSCYAGGRSYWIAPAVLGAFFVLNTRAWL